MTDDNPLFSKDFSDFVAATSERHFIPKESEGDRSNDDSVISSSPRHQGDEVGR